MIATNGMYNIIHKQSCKTTIPNSDSMPSVDDLTVLMLVACFV